MDQPQPCRHQLHLQKDLTDTVHWISLQEAPDVEAWYVCLRPLGVVRPEVRPPLVAARLAASLNTPPGLVPTPGVVCLSMLA